MGFSLKQTKDPELIASIMNMPEIMEKATNQVAINYSLEINDRSGWFIGYCDGRLSGIINAHHVNANTIEIHPYCIHPRSSRTLIKEFYKICLNYPDQLNKVICKIPECFKKTVNFARRVGFIDEGYLKESYNRDNKFIGVHVLGITRNEIEEYLNGRVS